MDPGSLVVAVKPNGNMVVTIRFQRIVIVVMVVDVATVLLMI